MRNRAWAEVAASYLITDPRAIDALSPYYIWTTDYAEKRLAWKRRHPLHVIVLRTYRIPRPVTVKVRPEYHGCRSWLELYRELPFEGTPRAFGRGVRACLGGDRGDSVGRSVAGARLGPQADRRRSGCRASGPPRRLSTYEGRWGGPSWLPRWRLPGGRAFAAPAGSGGEDPPTRRRVASAGGGERRGPLPRRDARAGSRRRSAQGALRARRLSGGTLCHGPVLAVGDRVVFSGYRGRRPVARAPLPLRLEGPPGSLGDADTFAPSATAGRLWLGRWRHPKSGVLHWRNRPTRVTLSEIDAASRVSARRRGLPQRDASSHAATADGVIETEGR